MSGVLWIYLGFTAGEIYSDLLKDVVVVELAEASNGGLNGGSIRGNLGLVLVSFACCCCKASFCAFSAAFCFFQLLSFCCTCTFVSVQGRLQSSQRLADITLKETEVATSCFLIVVGSSALTLSPG